jgi:MATE family multidrug resistance protein
MEKKMYTAQTAIADIVHTGETYKSLIKFFIPEYITSLVLYSLPFILDAYFIGCLKSTQAYGTLCASNSLFHFLIKAAEAVSVGAVILAGQSNGQGNVQKSGRVLRDAFLVTALLGGVIALILYIGAPNIYRWYVPEEMVAIGVPFLRLRALSVLFMFLFLAFVGFLRGVKNTQTPMRISMVGTVIFIACDYLFVFGGFGIEPLGLRGSAMASVVQYAAMFIIALVRVLYGSKYRKYEVNFFSAFREPIEWRAIIRLSLPVLIDKVTMAFAYLWLLKMIKPLGLKGVATFGIVHEMSRFALIPALALAQVVTFLVSNDLGAKNLNGIIDNIKKIVFMAMGIVCLILIGLSIDPARIIGYVDSSREFTPMAAHVFPLLSILALFDALQLVLSGALRGAADVRTVMLVRGVVCLVYFMPVSYLISYMPMEDIALKFLLIYGSFHIGNALMSAVYINRMRSAHWRTRIQL